jgi:hypothetical protein
MPVEAFTRPCSTRLAPSRFGKVSTSPAGREATLFSFRMPLVVVSRREPALAASNCIALPAEYAASTRRAVFCSFSTFRVVSPNASFDILPFLKEGDSYRRGLRRFLGGFLLLTAYIAIHFTG